MEKEAQRLATVSRIKKGQTVVVVHHRSAPWTNRLIDLGLHPGATAKILARYPLGGPILLAVGNAKIAISRAAADTVVVSPEMELDRSYIPSRENRACALRQVTPAIHCIPPLSLILRLSNLVPAFGRAPHPGVLDLSLTPRDSFRGLPGLLALFLYSKIYKIYTTRKKTL
ncbi:MAG TPA: ferrous iron transport protein A [Clostridia bacterium]|nr:ferrous iron transport protein A [Clostridia bacterium]